MFSIFQKPNPKNQIPIEECETEPLVPMPKETHTITAVVNPKKFVRFKSKEHNYSGVIIDTIVSTKWKKNPNINIIVVLKCNDKRTPLALKWVNECYCEQVDSFPTPNISSKMFNVDNWDIVNLTYIG